MDSVSLKRIRNQVRLYYGKCSNIEKDLCEVTTSTTGGQSVCVWNRLDNRCIDNSDIDFLISVVRAFCNARESDLENYEKIARTRIARSLDPMFDPEYQQECDVILPFADQAKQAFSERSSVKQRRERKGMLKKLLIMVGLFAIVGATAQVALPVVAPVYKFVAEIPAYANLYSAAKRGDEVGVYNALFDASLDPQETRVYALQSALEFGSVDIVRLVLQHSKDDIFTHNTKRTIDRWANLPEFDAARVLSLMEWNNFDPSIENNYALRRFARQGNLKVVKELLEDPRVDPAAMQSQALVFAIENDHYDVAEALLKDGRADAGARDGYVANNLYSKIFAETSMTPSFSRKVDLLKMVVQKLRFQFKPPIDSRRRKKESAAVTYAKLDLLQYLRRIRPEYARLVVSELLFNPQWQTSNLVRFYDMIEDSMPFVDTNALLRELPYPENRYNEYLKDPVVLRALRDKKTMPQVRKRYVAEGLAQRPIEWAVRNKKIDLVKTLLTFEEVPSSQLNDAFIVAAENGYVEIAKLLLDDARVDPTAENQRALLESIRWDRRKMFDFLLSTAEESQLSWFRSQQPTIDPNFNNQEALRFAKNLGRSYMIQRLEKIQ